MSRLDQMSKALDVDSFALTQAAHIFNEWGKRIGVKPVEIFKTALQSLDASHDGRAVPWRVRLRLFPPDRMDPDADTDPELAPDAPGTDIVHGLHGVSLWAAGILSAYHQSQGHALQPDVTDEFTRRIPSVRPTLSRNEGVAMWRVNYMVNGQAWLARVDLKREQPAANSLYSRGIRDTLTRFHSGDQDHSRDGV